MNGKNRAWFLWIVWVIVLVNLGWGVYAACCCHSYSSGSCVNKGSTCHTCDGWCNCCSGSCGDNGNGDPDPCKDVECNDKCVGNVRKFGGTCDNGDCKYQNKTCDYGCKDANCTDPDDDRALCEKYNFTWMVKECCGDDKAKDWGRVVYVSGEATDLLCLPGPKVVKSKEFSLAVFRAGQMDGLSSGPSWFICDYDKDSDCKNDFDQYYNCQDGFRVDSTCRYSNSTFICGGPKQSEQQFRVNSWQGTPASLMASSHDTDGKWYKSQTGGEKWLISWSNEVIGTASNPLEVKITDLDPNKKYKVEYDIYNENAGKNLFIKRTDQQNYQKYDIQHYFWQDPINLGEVTGVNNIGVHVYLNGGTGSYDSNLRNLIVTEVDAKLPDPGGIQAPIVKFNHDYLCYSPADKPETFVECCGRTVDECNWHTKNYTHNNEPVTWNYKLKGQTVTVGAVEYMCASDGRFYNASDIENNPQLCRDLGYIWVERMCCGNDPGEAMGRYTWLAENVGCCFSSNQCLVSNSGELANENMPETYFTTEKGPHCIGDSQYILDNKCENGIWRTRTKDIALHLHKIFENKNKESYVMYCDNYSNVLTYYNYISPTAENIEETYLEQTSCGQGSRKWSCVNNFCVISNPEGTYRIMGGSINNYPMGADKIKDLLSYSADCTDAINNNDGKFHKCGDYLWINNLTQSFIFSKDTGIGEQEINAAEAGLFESFLRNPFQTLFAFIRSIFTPTEQYRFTEDFVDSSDRYDKIYVYTAPEKFIRARYEMLYNEEGALKEILAVNYTGFDNWGICNSVNRNYPCLCRVSGDSAYVAAVGDYGQYQSIWQDMTSSLRVETGATPQQSQPEPEAVCPESPPQPDNQSPPQPGCTDSDGGQNYYVKGTATYSGTSKTDSCAYCTGFCPPTGPCPPVICGAVVEYYCTETGISNTTSVCPSNFSCKEGACVKKTEQKFPVPVLVITYIPVTADGKVNTSITGDVGTDDVNTLRDHISAVTSETVEAVEKGSTYHGYKDTSAVASLDYTVYRDLEFLKALPQGLKVPWGPAYRPDYISILTGINICDYVDNMGVKEVWLWGYHTDKIEPVESDMSMGSGIQSYWNYPTYGDVSNSERTNDLPICQKTYTLFNYNYGRQLGEAVEDHTHHITSVLGYVDSDMWNNLFVGQCGAQSFYRCGWTHYPPNVREYCSGHDYDWFNTRGVLSDCEDWKPDGSGQKKTVSCRTWNDYYHSEDYCVDDGGTAFKVWWMQNIPGRENGLTYNGKQLKNWWDFIGDFDNAIKSKSLVIP